MNPERNDRSFNSVLVTGGAGFIGSAYLRRFVPQYPDTQFICLDVLTYAGNIRNLGSLWNSPNFHFVKGSVTNGEFVSYLFGCFQFDCIIHFAAESHVDRSIDGELVFVDTNVLGTQVLLREARLHGSRFVMVSTDEVYGDLGPDDPPFTETNHIHPSSPYSASKAAADHLTLAAHRTFGTDVIITRCSNNYGPFQFPEKLIPLMIQNALSNLELPVYGDGQNIRDWIYVDDHVLGVETAARLGVSGKVYNLGGNCERRNLDVVKFILARLGKPEALIRFVTDRPGHDRRYAMDATLATRELGWGPVASFEDHLSKTIDWYVENQAWCDEIRSGAYRNLMPIHMDKFEG